ncbi:MAG TPA: shikimate kinase [Acidimicrobiia bacterium]|nr:shikimate kinase [Acidimicrobiia bacterium]
MVAFEDRNIVLTGFMGTGKSTVGRRVARMLGFDWVDTDHLIEERHGPIAEIFARAGEVVFRAIERNVARELSTRTRHVFSTGGRMLLDPENIRRFSTTGRIFCLQTPPETLIPRLLRSTTPRPLLDGPDPETRIRQLLEERRRGYARFASIDTGGGSPDDVAARLHEVVTTPTDTATGREGLAVLGAAVTGLPSPVTVVTDSIVGPLHAPCVGDALVVDPTATLATPTVVYLGGTAVTDLATRHGAAGTVVLAPTTPTSIARCRDRTDVTRVVADLATLQTLEP